MGANDRECAPRIALSQARQLFRRAGQVPSEGVRVFDVVQARFGRSSFFVGQLLAVGLCTLRLQDGNAL